MTSIDPAIMSEPSANTTAIKKQLTKAERMAKLKEKITKYRSILTNGCGNWRCTNPNCFTFTGTAYTEREGSLRAVELFKEGAAFCDGYEQSELIPLRMSELAHLASDAAADSDEKADEFVRELDLIKKAFDHWEILEISFLDGEIVSETNPAINFGELDAVFGILQARESTAEVATDALSTVIGMRKDEGEQKEMSLNELRSILILMENPLIVSEDPSTYELLEAFLELIHKLPSDNRRILKQWLTRYDDLDRLERMIFCLQQCITIRLLECEENIVAMSENLTIPVPEDADEDEIAEFRGRFIAQEEHRMRNQFLAANMTSVFECLQLIFEANEDIRCEFLDGGYGASMGTRSYLKRDVFYNDCISNDLFGAGTASAARMLMFDYISWSKGLGFTYLGYPFLLNAASKASYIAKNNDYARRSEMRGHMIEMLFMGVPHEMFQLRLLVTRDNLIRDTLGLLQGMEGRDLRQQLVVKFDGEDGVDQGGVKKEFFQLIVEQLFDVQYGMFVFDEETQTFWFNKASFEEQNMNYRLIGILLGLSIYNNVILDINFPKVVFKKLLNLPLMFEDFVDFDPTMANGFVALKNYEEDDLSEVFCRRFSVEYEYFGGTRCDELKEGGNEIELTRENREEYIDLYIDYVMSKSVQSQFDAFKDGFYQVCSGENIVKLLSFMTAEELEMVICGSGEFDFEELEASCRYDDGFNEDSQTVRDFWEIAHGLSEEDKRKLLAFCTGSDRVPVRGLSDLKLTISMNGTDDARLPTSHTCFNHLLLPQYSSREILFERLQTAIQNSQGFGLI